MDVRRGSFVGVGNERWLTHGLDHEVAEHLVEGLLAHQLFHRSERDESAVVDVGVPGSFSRFGDGVLVRVLADRPSGDELETIPVLALVHRLRERVGLHPPQPTRPSA